MIANCTRWLHIAAATYLLLIATSALNFWRSLAFGLGGLCALLLLLAGWRRLGPRVPSPGKAVLTSLAIWSAWACMSLAWSVDPAYTAHELKREIGYSLIVMLTFYVVAATVRGWRTALIAALSGFTLVAAFALGLAASPADWDPGAWHQGVGAYSTYVVLVAPLLPMLLARPPAGFGRNRVTLLLGFALLLLLLVTARLTENRMVWLALAAVFVTMAAVALMRWHSAVAIAPARWMVPLFVLLVVLGALFVNVAREKSHQLYPGQATVATLASDPRFGLWEHAAERIGARPWGGYGFGKLILADEFRRALSNPLLTHPHNVFLSQWLQLGAAGAAAFVALLAALAWRFTRFLRSPNDTLAVVGTVGVALVVGFVVKNFADDFLAQSNAKEFWALSAMLLGFGCMHERSIALPAPSG